MSFDPDKFDFDFIVIGSGFGGSVSALRLTEKGYRVGVLEMGRRWTPENLPKTSWQMHRWFWRPGIALRGFFNMRFFRHVTILHGCAVGGGSITYAGTMLRPFDKVWDNGSWKGLDDWSRRYPSITTRRLECWASPRTGFLVLLTSCLAKSLSLSESAIRFTALTSRSSKHPREFRGVSPFPIPTFFGGEGPDRTTCEGCGGCMMGCRHGAKNTLDMNYLYLAEKRGAQVFAETRVVDVKPLGAADGNNGY